MEAYLPMLKDALGMFLFLGVELSVLFILISAGVSLLQQYIPDSKIQKLLGASNGRGYVMAAGLGAITPFCTCSTIPMLRGLLRAKAGFGPTLTFLFASPLLNPIIVGLFVVTFGLKVTIIYTVIALVVSVVGGYILQSFNFEKYVSREALQQTDNVSCCGTAQKAESSCCDAAPKSTVSSCCAPKKELEPMACCAPAQESTQACCAPARAEQQSCCAPQSLEPLAKPAMPFTPMAPEASCCAGPNTNEESVHGSSEGPCCSAEPKAVGITFKKKVQLALKDGYTQFKQVMPYLLLGISLGAIIYGFVPSDFIATYASSDSLFAVPFAAVIGIPLYVRVEALIPLSAVLEAKGMGLGAIMALIIGGGGASLTEVILLKSLFKTPVILAFLAVVLIMAIGAGYIFQFAL